MMKSPDDFMKRLNDYPYELYYDNPRFSDKLFDLEIKF